MAFVRLLIILLLFASLAEPAPGPFLTHSEWVMAILTFIYVCVSIGMWRTIRKQATHMETQTQHMGSQVAEMKAAGEQTGKLIEQSAKQVAELQTLAQAAKENATAANLNAQSIINAERAWVLCKIKSYNEQYAQQRNFACVVVNCGHTPAEIIGIQEQRTFYAVSTELSLPPDYGLETRLTQRRLLAPNEEWEFDQIAIDQELPKDVWDEVRNSRMRYWYYGRVLYQDTVNRKTTHESMFCYFFSPTIQKFIPGGPYEYTLYT